MSLKSKVSYDPAPSQASREVVSPSMNRVGIQFFAPAVGRVTLSNDPVTADGNGLVLEAGQGSTLFRLDTHGDCIRRAWYALYSVGATGVSWIDILP